MPISRNKKTDKKTDKKPEVKVPEKAKSSIALQVERIAKKHKGSVLIQMASEVASPYSLRRPTPLENLNIALGGGFPAGGGVEIHGGESTGKTFLVYATCGMNQQIHGANSRIIIYPTELKPDKSFARMAGFCVPYSDGEIEEMEEIRGMNGLPPFTLEEKEDLKMCIGDVVFVQSPVAEDGLQVLIDFLSDPTVKDTPYQLAIVDSFGSLLTKKMEEGKVGDKHYSGAAGVVTMFQNMINTLWIVGGLETTLIAINQLRANVGAGMWDDDVKSAMGAWSWKHGQLVNLSLEKRKAIRDPETKDNIGHMVHWEITKGKAGTHDGKRGEYEYYHFPKMSPVFWKDVQETYFGGLGVYEDLATAAKKLNVIEISGAWVSWGGHPGKAFRCQGIDRFSQYIAEDEGVAQVLREQCRRKAGLLVRYK